MIDSVFDQVKRFLPGVKKNVSLKNHTTFKIGGPAKYFFVASTKKDALKAITIAKKINLPMFVLGGGSNLLVSDQGFDGLVIKLKSKESIVLKKNTIIEAPAGVALGKVVAFSIKHSLQGLEWAGGLPGTFGGAIRGNAGAFGGEIKDAILEVQALDSNFNLVTLSNAQCHFSYRSSMMKEKKWVTLFAKVHLKKGIKKELDAIAKSHIAYRKEKHPLEYPSAGSVFKNVAFKELSPEFQKEFSDKVKKDPFEIVPAAWFIIGAGLVGKQIGQVQISQKHSN